MCEVLFYFEVVGTINTLLLCGYLFGGLIVRLSLINLIWRFNCEVISY